MRLCIDQLRSARAQRELYVGQWLPEPLPTGQHQELVDSVVLRESLSFAFLIMLQRLKPLERAVFLLREVFDYDYAEIAAVVGKSQSNCRQVLHRAHRHIGEQPTALCGIARTAATYHLPVRPGDDQWRYGRAIATAD